MPAGLLAAFGGLATSQLRADTALAGNSPFLPPGVTAASAGPGAPTDYLLAGSSVSGSHTLVCIVQSDGKRSRWISVGETLDGIQVVSFDASHDRAVIVARGARRELTMRTTSITGARAATPAPAPAVFIPEAPPAAAVASGPPPPPPAPGTAAHDEAEARMMVSDLLEIGMQQRKAYEDAKQKGGTPPAQPLN